MCFTETYLKKDHDISTFTNQFDFHTHQSENVPGSYKHGILICVSSSLQTKKIATLQTNHVEYCAVIVEKQKTVIVCAVYMRPSTNLSERTHDLDLILASFPQHLPIILTGDFNCDIRTNENNSVSNFLLSKGFRQFIHKSTTDYGSVLDHVYVSKSDVLAVDIIDTYFSDHDTVIVTLDM
jgi:endonuclease/exonuclease/phosphatase (EEP) superfamily protein YafD